MKAGDVTETLNLALQASKLDQVHVVHRPRLLSDNGPSYISAELAEWLTSATSVMSEARRVIRKYRARSSAGIRCSKNRILLENYYFPDDLEAKIAAFVERYNHRRFHESLNNLTLADVYSGRGPKILMHRKRIKRVPIQNRRLQHQ